MAKGYTKIDNDLFLELSRLDISAHDMRVLLFIIRKTICFHRQSHEMAVGLISKSTGISERQVKRVLKRLCEQSIIEIEKPAVGSHPQIIKILGDISGQAWGHFRSVLGDTDVTHSGDTDVTQENKEKNKEKNKREEKEFSLSKTDFTDENGVLDEYAWNRYLMWKEQEEI